MHVSQTDGQDIRKVSLEIRTEKYVKDRKSYYYIIFISKVVFIFEVVFIFVFEAVF